MRVGPLHALAFAPDGQTLAVAGSNSWVQLWDLAVSCRVAEFHGQTGLLKCVAFSPDGRIFASGGSAGAFASGTVPRQSPERWPPSAPLATRHIPSRGLRFRSCRWPAAQGEDAEE
jgi:WD40 repeat protein